MPQLFRINNIEHAKVTEVLPGLLLSGICGLDRKILIQSDVTLIVNTTEEIPDIKIIQRLPRVRMWLRDDSDSRFMSQLGIVCTQIHSTLKIGGRVLIHSVQGVSRCAALCLAYLTKYNGMSLREAYFFLVEKRPLVDPNIGFWRQLIAFEQECTETVGTVKIVRDRYNPEKLVPDVYPTAEKTVTFADPSDRVNTEVEATSSAEDALVHSDQQATTNDSARRRSRDASWHTTSQADQISATEGSAFHRTLSRWSRRRHMRTRANSLISKFQPVLATVPETQAGAMLD